MYANTSMLLFPSTNRVCYDICSYRFLSITVIMHIKVFQNHEVFSILQVSTCNVCMIIYCLIHDDISNSKFKYNFHIDGYTLEIINFLFYS